jgi:hypothetical protein
MMAGRVSPNENSEQAHRIYIFSYLQSSKLSFDSKEGVQNICTSISSQSVEGDALDVNPDMNVKLKLTTIDMLDALAHQGEYNQSIIAIKVNM